MKWLRRMHRFLQDSHPMMPGEAMALVLPVLFAVATPAVAQAPEAAAPQAPMPCEEARGHLEALYKGTVPVSLYNQAIADVRNFREQAIILDRRLSAASAELAALRQAAAKLKEPDKKPEEKK
jgi:phage terminase Nu1 subunit (DNA packaging protein)